MFAKKDNELDQAMAKRSEAKNAFIEVANNKETSKREILEFYKRYRRANDHFFNLFEKSQKEGGEYDKVA